ncbi:hypothetical protein ACFL49_00130 [Candidatus Omnitrophota bacterium]
MAPDHELGAKFWERINAQVEEALGGMEVPKDLFHKIWIVPAEAVIYEHENSAFVVESRLKVMMDIDYLSMIENGKEKGDQAKKYQSSNLDLQSSIIKEIIIPEITKEVNEGTTFANLRQIYNSVILASWYKDNLRESLLGQVYVDKAKTKGVDTQDKTTNQKIYNQYVESFKKGVANYIREEYDPKTQEIIPRKYFTGGADFAMNAGQVKRTVYHLTVPGAGGLLQKTDKAQMTVDLAMFSPHNNEVINASEEKFKFDAAMITQIMEDLLKIVKKDGTINRLEDVLAGRIPAARVKEGVAPDLTEEHLEKLKEQGIYVIKTFEGILVVGLEDGYQQMMMSEILDGLKDEEREASEAVAGMNYRAQVQAGFLASQAVERSRTAELRKMVTKQINQSETKDVFAGTTNSLRLFLLARFPYYLSEMIDVLVAALTAKEAITSLKNEGIFINGNVDDGYTIEITDSAMLTLDGAKARLDTLPISKALSEALGHRWQDRIHTAIKGADDMERKKRYLMVLNALEVLDYMSDQQHESLLTSLGEHANLFFDSYHEGNWTDRMPVSVRSYFRVEELARRLAALNAYLLKDQNKHLRFFPFASAAFLTISSDHDISSYVDKINGFLIKLVDRLDADEVWGRVLKEQYRKLSDSLNSYQDAYARHSGLVEYAANLIVEVTGVDFEEAKLSLLPGAEDDVRADSAMTAHDDSYALYQKILAGEKVAETEPAEKWAHRMGRVLKSPLRDDFELASDDNLTMQQRARLAVINDFVGSIYAVGSNPQVHAYQFVPVLNSYAIVLLGVDKSSDARQETGRNYGILSLPVEILDLDADFLSRNIEAGLYSQNSKIGLPWGEDVLTKAILDIDAQVTLEPSAKEKAPADAEDSAMLTGKAFDDESLAEYINDPANYADVLSGEKDEIDIGVMKIAEGYVGRLKIVKKDEAVELVLSLKDYRLKLDGELRQKLREDAFKFIRQASQKIESTIKVFDLSTKNQEDGFRIKLGLQPQADHAMLMMESPQFDNGAEINVKRDLGSGYFWVEVIAPKKDDFVETGVLIHEENLETAIYRLEGVEDDEKKFSAQLQELLRTSFIVENDPKYFNGIQKIPFNGKEKLLDTYSAQIGWIGNGSVLVEIVQEKQDEETQRHLGLMPIGDFFLTVKQLSNSVRQTEKPSSFLRDKSIEDIHQNVKKMIEGLAPVDAMLIYRKGYSHEEISIAVLDYILTHLRQESSIQRKKKEGALLFEDPVLMLVSAEHSFGFLQEKVLERFALEIQARFDLQRFPVKGEETIFLHRRGLSSANLEDIRKDVIRYLEERKKGIERQWPAIQESKLYQEHQAFLKKEGDQAMTAEQAVADIAASYYETSTPFTWETFLTHTKAHPKLRSFRAPSIKSMFEKCLKKYAYKVDPEKGTYDLQGIKDRAMMVSLEGVKIFSFDQESLEAYFQISGDPQFGRDQMKEKLVRELFVKNWGVYITLSKTTDSAPTTVELETDDRKTIVKLKVEDDSFIHAKPQEIRDLLTELVSDQAMTAKAADQAKAVRLQVENKWGKLVQLANHYEAVRFFDALLLKNEGRRLYVEYPAFPTDFDPETRQVLSTEDIGPKDIVVIKEGGLVQILSFNGASYYHALKNNFPKVTAKDVLDQAMTTVKNGLQIDLSTGAKKILDGLLENAKYEYGYYRGQWKQVAGSAKTLESQPNVRGPRAAADHYFANQKLSEEIEPLAKGARKWLSEIMYIVSIHDAVGLTPDAWALKLAKEYDLNFPEGLRFPEASSIEFEQKPNGAIKNIIVNFVNGNQKKVPSLEATPKENSYLVSSVKFPRNMPLEERVILSAVVNAKASISGRTQIKNITDSEPLMTADASTGEADQAMLTIDAVLTYINITTQDGLATAVREMEAYAEKKYLKEDVVLAKVQEKLATTTDPVIKSALLDIAIHFAKKRVGSNRLTAEDLEIPVNANKNAIRTWKMDLIKTHPAKAVAVFVTALKENRHAQKNKSALMMLKALGMPEVLVSSWKGSSKEEKEKIEAAFLGIGKMIVPGWINMMVAKEQYYRKEGRRIGRQYVWREDIQKVIVDRLVAIGTDVLDELYAEFSNEKLEEKGWSDVQILQPAFVIAKIGDKERCVERLKELLAIKGRWGSHWQGKYNLIANLLYYGFDQKEYDQVYYGQTIYNARGGGARVDRFTRHNPPKERDEAVAWWSMGSEDRYFFNKQSAGWDRVKKSDQAMTADVSSLGLGLRRIDQGDQMTKTSVNFVLKGIDSLDAQGDAPQLSALRELKSKLKLEYAPVSSGTRKILQTLKNGEDYYPSIHFSDSQKAMSIELGGDIFLVLWEGNHYHGGVKNITVEKISQEGIDQAMTAQEVVKHYIEEMDPSVEQVISQMESLKELLGTDNWSPGDVVSLLQTIEEIRQELAVKTEEFLHEISSLDNTGANIAHVVGNKIVAPLAPFILYAEDEQDITLERDAILETLERSMAAVQQGREGLEALAQVEEDSPDEDKATDTDQAMTADGETLAVVRQMRNGLEELLKKKMIQAKFTSGLRGYTRHGIPFWQGTIHAKNTSTYAYTNWDSYDADPALSRVRNVLEELLSRLSDDLQVLVLDNAEGDSDYFFTVSGLGIGYRNGFDWFANSELNLRDLADELLSMLEKMENEILEEVKKGDVGNAAAKDKAMMVLRSPIKVFAEKLESLSSQGEVDEIVEVLRQYILETGNTPEAEAFIDEAFTAMFLRNVDLLGTSKVDRIYYLDLLVRKLTADKFNEVALYHRNDSWHSLVSVYPEVVEITIDNLKKMSARAEATTLKQNPFIINRPIKVFAEKLESLSSQGEVDEIVEVLRQYILETGNTPEAEAFIDEAFTAMFLRNVDLLGTSKVDRIYYLDLLVRKLTADKFNEVALYQRNDSWHSLVSVHPEVVEITINNLLQMVDSMDSIKEAVIDSTMAAEAADQAMAAKAVDGPSSMIHGQKVAEYGGINLDRSLLDIKIKRDGNGLPLPVFQQPPDILMNIEGFIPVIINITPVTNMPMLLGLADRPEDNTAGGTGQAPIQDFDRVKTFDMKQPEEISYLN